jgi:tetratricopeptide (TPR) repeat protein
LHERVEALLAERLGPQSPGLLNALNRRGLVLAAMDDLEAAIAAFESAIELGSPVLGSSSPDVLMVKMNLAMALSLAGRHARAIELLDLVLAERRKIFGEDSARFVMSLTQASGMQARAGDFEGAEATLRRATELLEGLGADKLHSAQWLPELLAAQRELVSAWQRGPAALGGSFLEAVRHLKVALGPTTGTLFSGQLMELRALREQHGSLPAEVEAFLATVYASSE